MSKLRVLAVAVAAGALAAAACTPLGLNTASRDIAREEPASPPLLAALDEDVAVTTWEEWRDRRAPQLRALLEEAVYGPFPEGLAGVEIARRVVDPGFLDGLASLEEITIRVGSGEGARDFNIALALPAGAAAAEPAALLLTQNFCGNPATMGAPALSPPLVAWPESICGPDGMGARVGRLIFGAYILESPVADVLARGVAFATVYPSELVADDAAQAAADLARFASQFPEGRAPTGALAVWAGAFLWALDVLEADPRIDASQTAIYGHSRHGKAALVAAAWDERVDAVISHQSGKGGATLTRSYAGETVKQITSSYPHWFGAPYAAWAADEASSPVDQHQLLALIAPRPVLLGNGWRDVWSDPNGSFRAAQGADPAWRLAGVDGLTQTGLGDEERLGRLEFFMRPGAHGVRKVDWERFLAFLDRAFALPPEAPATATDPLPDPDPDPAPTPIPTPAAAAVAAGGRGIETSSADAPPPD